MSGKLFFKEPPQGEVDEGTERDVGRERILGENSATPILFWSGEASARGIIVSSRDAI